MMEKKEARAMGLIHTRTDTAQLLLDLIRPLKSFYSPGNTRLHLGETCAHYGQDVAGMEGFARILWGLGPLWSQDLSGLPSILREESEEWLLRYRDGIVHGTDPEHEEYWGDVVDYDQRMVEMAPLAVAIALSPEKLWNPLTEQEKQNLYRWMNQINFREVHPNNWRFFRILVNMLFALLGLPDSEARLEDDKKVIEACYTGDGWYYDGNPGQVDYYISFAIHFYGLIYSSFMKERDREYAAVLQERAACFSRDFVYWFGNDGNEIPYGRSLTYRFAHSAFFAALGYAEAGGISLGVMKNLVLRNLEAWIRRPIFDSAGILTIGYGYSNLMMSERYNAPGSPYWALKAFFILAMGEDHPFWQAKEEEFAYEEQKQLKHPHMVITHTADHHVLAYPTGQHCKPLGACPEKYEKFVYSNQFGFSVSRGGSLSEGAFDNTLAVSLAGQEHYRMRYGLDYFWTSENEVVSGFRILPGVQVESHVIPFGSWHVRLHQIRTEHAVEIADGGFAIPVESMKYTKEWIRREEHGIAAVMPWGISRVVSLTGGDGVIVDAFPNTNLFYGLTIIPVIRQRLEPGVHVIITCVMAGRTKQLGRPDIQVPAVSVEESCFTAEYMGKRVKGEIGRRD